MTDAAGTVVWRADYEPFGALATESGTMSTTHQFTGRERDAETGLHYFGARYYDGALGRFTSSDPFNPIRGFTSREDLEAYLSNPQRWNQYAYALNNPFKYVDPDGNYAFILSYLQRLSTSPTAQRVATYVSRQGTRLYNAATRFFNSPAGQEAVQTAAETVSGVPMPTSPRAGLRAIDTWGNPKTLARHFGDHGADFGARDAEDYARLASDFFERGVKEGLSIKVEVLGPKKIGDIRIYDPKTNIYGVYRADGRTRTFYKPDASIHGRPTNLDYWNSQGGVPLVRQGELWVPSR